VLLITPCPREVRRREEEVGEEVGERKGGEGELRKKAQDNFFLVLNSELIFFQVPRN
jgi:hypothetical protein